MTMLVCTTYYLCVNRLTDSIITVYNDIVRAINAGEVSQLGLLDLSAVFDTVDHGILLEVLQNRFAVQNCALNRFKSYLSDHPQSFV